MKTVKTEWAVQQRVGREFHNVCSSFKELEVDEYLDYLAKRFGKGKYFKAVRTTTTTVEERVIE